MDPECRGEGYKSYATPTCPICPNGMKATSEKMCNEGDEKDKKQKETGSDMIFDDIFWWQVDGADCRACCEPKTCKEDAHCTSHQEYVYIISPNP